MWFRSRLVPWLLPLLPVSWLFGVLVALRRSLFCRRLLTSFALPAPVVVVGNVTVGGSGKTPLVIWLIERLRAQGWSPGVISRGYRGAASAILEVVSDSDPSVVGDEPLLLARRTGVPVFVGRDRVAAGRALLKDYPACNVIVSDDGLQHYRLQRAAEIAVFDGRGAGNARLLPAGPLREPLRRLRDVDAVVWNGRDDAPGAAKRLTSLGFPEFDMRLTGERFFLQGDPRRSCTAADLRGKRLHALAGIGHPERFFRQLRAMGLQAEEHPFPDHHAYRPQDLSFARGEVLLMTEKDAVKCPPFLDVCEAWVLPVAAQLSEAADGRSLLGIILEKLDGCPSA